MTAVEPLTREDWQLVSDALLVFSDEHAGLPLYDEDVARSLALMHRIDSALELEAQLTA